MNKAQAQTERKRLQKLLQAYEASRVQRQDEDDLRQLKRDVIPDRADNVRARIARLDEIISGRSKPEGSKF